MQRREYRTINMTFEWLEQSLKALSKLGAQINILSIYRLPTNEARYIKINNQYNAALSTVHFHWPASPQMDVV
jgi:hypothetical protein